MEGDRDLRSGIRLGISERAAAIGGNPRDKEEEVEEEEVVAVSVLAQINGERARRSERWGVLLGWHEGERERGMVVAAVLCRLP